MGLIAPTLPDIDLAEWRKKPYRERIHSQVLHWAEYGFGTPVAVYFLYILKMAGYVLVPAWVIAASTPDLGGLSEVGQWWTEPIVFQKFVIFTILFEVLGFGCGSGPLTFRFLPPIGHVTYWLRPGTIRLPPWPKVVPFTRGDERTVFDVLLYAGVIAALVAALIADGVPGGPGQAGLLPAAPVVAVVGLLALVGLRDKTIFLSARADQYWWMAIAFLFPFVDMIVATKLIMVLVWWGAATSKLNHHFPYVVSVMISNSPVMRSKWVKRKLFRKFPTDMRPSRLSMLLAHTGTVIEYTVPLLLLLSNGGMLTTVCIAIMIIFHVHIISTLPAGVPLEWNIFVIFGSLFLWGQYHGPGYGFGDVSNPLLVAGMVGVVVALIVLGNMKPAWLSFLFGMRYYAGNWATTWWLMRPGVEDTMQNNVVKSAGMTINQLNALYDPDASEFMLQKAVAWRSMHAHGRALLGLVPRAVPNPDEYVLREGEFHCGALIGWNFGEGHFHNEQLIEALQRRCNFAEGDVRVIVLEAQPIHRQDQQYRIVDAATGVVEEGVVRVADMVPDQPWLGREAFPGEQPSFPVRLSDRPLVSGHSSEGV